MQLLGKMSTPSFPGLSTCVACAQRLSRRSALIPTLVGVRARGKKTYTKTKAIPVRLREDLPGYGKKGTIVPMIRGQMRNFYFPHRVADYITTEEKRQLKQKNVVIARDVMFGRAVAEEGAEIKAEETRLVDQPGRPATRRATPIRVQIDVLQPSQAYSVLDRILPSSVVFYRTPITQQIKTSSKESIPLATPQPTQSTGDLAGPSQSLYPIRTTAIYGSVSSGDIATSVKALIAASEEAAGRIVIGEEDIRFVQKSEEKDRVKHLGDYDIEIKIKGHSDTLLRRVKVLAEDDADIDLEAGQHAVDVLAGETPIKGNISQKVSVAEGQTRQAQEVMDALEADLQDLKQKGRIGTEPVRLTPAEEAEVELRGDVVPKRRGKEVVVEGEPRQKRR